MKHFFFALLTLSLLASCSTYEKTDLYGHWKNGQWEFVFNEDGTCKIGQNGTFLGGENTYRTFGNTLEIVRNGKVYLSNLTVKGIENDKLSLEFRQAMGAEGMDNVQVLSRVE